MSEFKDSFDIQTERSRCYVSPRVQAIHDKKMWVSHVKVEKCPMPNPRSAPECCLDCDFTDIISRCCYPVNINEGIKEGKLLPWEEGDDE